jgi:hypothetical protein
LTFKVLKKAYRDFFIGIGFDLITAGRKCKELEIFLAVLLASFWLFMGPTNIFVTLLPLIDIFLL